MATAITVDPFSDIMSYDPVRQFVADFANWNKVALVVMGSISMPYRSLQEDLVSLMSGKIGETLLDYGSGDGGIVSLMLRRGMSPKQVIAVDPDDQVLDLVPGKLRQAGFNGEVKLMRSASMVNLLLPDESLDSIVSGLGGITYAGFHLNGHGLVEGQEALKECLLDCWRVLKPGGILGFSSLKPDPDFREIKRQSILYLIRTFQIRNLLTAISKAKQIEKASAFMKAASLARRAHYLPHSKWEEVLTECGFEVTGYKSGGYAGQGLVIVARKL